MDGQQKVGFPETPFGFLPLLLKDFQPPKEPFEPDGAWQLTYRVFVVGMIAEKYRQWGCIPSGMLQIKRMPKQDETFTLQVNLFYNQSIERRGSGIDRIEAEICCKNDEFAGILGWRRLSWLLTPEKQQVGIEHLGLRSRLKTEGKVEGGQIVLREQGRERRVQAPSPLTCDWAMIDVVQRLAKSGFQKMLQFAMLEELEFLRLNQRLVLHEPMEIEFEGRKFRWNRFEQFGDGVLPWTYCLDEHRRLVLAFSAMRAILLMGS